jgi:hypothetical protein
MEALGAVTATITFPEVYTALATGTVDGQDNPAPTVYSQKFHEVQKHLALTKHVYTPMMLVANGRAWQRLTPEQRAAVTKRRKAGNEARRQVQEKEAWFVERGWVRARLRTPQVGTSGAGCTARRMSPESTSTCAPSIFAASPQAIAKRPLSRTSTLSPRESTLVSAASQAPWPFAA